jgi:hypothetical protein
VQITITTLTAVKNSDCTTAAEATPATDEPRMLERKSPIIAAVPAWAGVSALIAVPPCDAAQAVLKRSPLCGYAARMDVAPGQSDERRLRGFQRQREHEPVDRDIADALDDVNRPSG